MSLLQRVEAARQGTVQGATPGSPPVEAARPLVGVPVAPARRRSSHDEELHNLRMRLADEVVDAFAAVFDISKPDEMRRKLIDMVDGFVDRHIIDLGTHITREERRRLVDGVVYDVTGFGPIEPLLADASVTEVMVNGPDKVYIERAGKIEKANVHFRDDDHVLNVIDRIITPIGRRIDESSPRVDARLPDGSRVNAIIKPLSLIGPVITVRKFATRFTVEELIGFGTASAEMFDFLRACIEARLNVFLSGSTGSGKTTTLNVLSSFIPDDERIITIEDAAELRLSQKHVITLESRPANLEGHGEITIRDLLRNALHMRPDRIIVGECRAGEALDMVQAMTTGHDGSLSTGHSNSPRDMLRRLETMILMTGYDLPLRAIREQIASAVDLIVHTSRLRDGSRKIVSITEVYGVEDEDILTQEIFAFQQSGFRDGRIEGQLTATGIRPLFMDIFRTRGIELPPGEFGIPAADPSRPALRGGKARWGVSQAPVVHDGPIGNVGQGTAVTAGGMVYVSSVGPVDPEIRMVLSDDLKDQTRQCIENLRARLEETGSSLDRIVWANWSLRDASEFDVFYSEWLRWFPGDAPVGQGTLMPLSHRRAGFRVSIGVIAALAEGEAEAEIRQLPAEVPIPLA